MKAAVLTHYDKNGTELDIREIPTPIPEEGEVPVSGNCSSCHFITV